MKGPDEFSSYLQALRRQHRLSAKALSEKIGKSATYITGWERRQQPINLRVLHQVADSLELTQAERVELLRRAEARNLPDQVARVYYASDDLQLNVHEALTAIEHDLAPMIARQGQALLDLAECGSWLLSCYACAALEYGPARFRWPDTIYDYHIVDHGYKSTADLTFPAHLVSGVFPTLSPKDRLTKPIVQELGLAMADAFRRWFVSDLDRCRQAASALRRWSLTLDPDVGPTASFIFADVDAQAFTILDVTPYVVSTVLRRDLAAYLWQSANTRPRSDPFTLYHPRSEPVDSAAYEAFRAAKNLPDDIGRPLKRRALQAFRHGLFILRSSAWRSIETISMIVNLMLEFEPGSCDPRFSDMLRSLRSADPALQAECYPFLDDVRSMMLNYLEDAERRMSRELDRAESALPTRRQSGKPNPKAPKKKAKRKPAKNSRKKKPKGK